MYDLDTNNHNYIYIGSGILWPMGVPGESSGSQDRKAFSRERNVAWYRSHRVSILWNAIHRAWLDHKRRV